MADHLVPGAVTPTLPLFFPSCLPPTLPCEPSPCSALCCSSRRQVRRRVRTCDRWPAGQGAVGAAGVPVSRH